MAPNLQSLLERSSARHSHLCPRQVLGVRMGLAARAALGMDLPRSDKRLLVILETDGCFANGIEVATGCTIGHRTLRVVDYGKVAATFIAVRSGQAVRLAPLPGVRQAARSYAPEETRRYFAQLKGYQRMPTAELFSYQEVQLTTPVEVIVSRAGVRATCEHCGEEVINEREVLQDGVPLCRSCASPGYYQVVKPKLAVTAWPAVLAREIAS